MFGSLGVPELLIILVIIVVLFGVNKLPRLGKGLGEGIKNFKDSLRSQRDQDSETEESSKGEAADPK